MDTINPVPEQPIAPVEPKKSWLSAHKILVSIIVAAVVVAAGASAYFVMTSGKVNQSDLQPVVHQQKIDPTADWKTYQGPGFTMLYPADWTVDSGSFYPPGKHKDLNAEYSGSIIVDTQPNPKSLDLKDFYQQLNTQTNINYYNESVSQTSFAANYEAEKFIGVYGEISSDTISVNKGNSIIEITDVGEGYPQILDAMAKSVK